VVGDNQLVSGTTQVEKYSVRASLKTLLFLFNGEELKVRPNK